MADRNRLQVDERRAQLLELGLTLFGAAGYDEVSIDEIAKTAGVSKGLLYHYFGSKRAFYVETLRVAAGQLHEATEVHQHLPPNERAAAGVLAYLEFVEARSESYLALMQGGVGSDKEIVNIIQGSRQAFLTRMLEGLGLERPSPIFRNAARAWIGSVEAASIDWLQHRDVDKDTLLSMLLQTLLATMTIASQTDPQAGAKLGNEP